MIRTRITDSIDYIEPTDIHPSMSSAALVISSSPKTVIDLNLSEIDTESVLKELQPERAYATHFHTDHSRFWLPVSKFSSAEFFVPGADELMLSSRESFLKNTFGEHGTGEIRDISYELLGYKEIGDYRVYNDGHRIGTGSSVVESVLTPGHSQAHMSFYLASEKVLFTGDLGLDRFGPWYGWVSCEIEPYIESLLKLQSFKAETLLTSHNGIIHSNIDQAWDDSLRHFFKRERFIRDQLDEGKSINEILEKGVFYANKDRIKEPMQTVVRIWDRIILDHHMKILEDSSLEKRFPELSARLLKDLN